MSCLYCKKCGHPVEITDIEIVGNSWKRYYLYCFECDLEYNILRREKTKDV